MALTNDDGEAIAETERKLREMTAECARALGVVLPEGVGFALFIFDLGDKGFISYASNADRDDMNHTLRQHLARQEIS